MDAFRLIPLAQPSADEVRQVGIPEDFLDPPAFVPAQKRQEFEPGISHDCGGCALEHRHQCLPVAITAEAYQGRRQIPAQDLVACVASFMKDPEDDQHHHDRQRAYSDDN
jgi:hypothetical protein